MIDQTPRCRGVRSLVFWALLAACQQGRQVFGSRTVALSGGVWQNMLLLSKTTRLLQADGFTVLVHRRTPTNDGCISLGQAVAAASIQMER